MTYTIEIEEMLFGDYRVCVWDEHLDGVLDKDYFCRGYESALMTALRVQADFHPESDVLVRYANTPEPLLVNAGKKE